MITKQDIFDKIQNSPHYPALPHDNQVLLHEFYTHHSLSINEIIALVENNLPLANSILKSVNSPIFNPEHPVDKVQNAVMLLGAESVCNIAIQNMLLEFFPPEKLPGQKFDIAIYWHHLVAVALAAEKIGKLIHHEDVFRLFTYGLLHDIGVIVLDACLPELIDKIEEKVNAGMNPFLAEKLVLAGLTHAEIGSWVCQQWGLGPHLYNITLYHHTPASSPNPNIDLYIISIAEILGDRYYAALQGYNIPQPVFSLTALAYAGVTLEQLLAIEQQLPHLVEKFLHPYKVT